MKIKAESAVNVVVVSWSISTKFRVFFLHPLHGHTQSCISRQSNMHGTAVNAPKATLGLQGLSQLGGYFCYDDE